MSGHEATRVDDVDSSRGGAYMVYCESHRMVVGVSMKYLDRLEKDNAYRVAVEFGQQQGQEDPASDAVAFWSAWRAARNAAAALLNKAEELNLTPEQMEALTRVAEKVAYD
jgi:hypothetical protein